MTKSQETWSKKLKAINADIDIYKKNKNKIIIIIIIIIIRKTNKAHPLTPGFRCGRGHGGRRSRSALAIV